MHAGLIMTHDVITCHPDQKLADVIKILNKESFRMMPVVDEYNKIVGAVNTLAVLSKLVPEYIVKGYLKSIPYAPDMGLLRKHYKEILNVNVGDVMERNPTIVRENDSLLSVTAEVITYDRFEYAIVVNDNNELVGIIASSDILRSLSKFADEKIFDA
ncbi:MAG: CBS domain-containing protein [Mariprofundaceae bacterium]